MAVTITQGIIIDDIEKIVGKKCADPLREEPKLAEELKIQLEEAKATGGVTLEGTLILGLLDKLLNTIDGDQEKKHRNPKEAPKKSK